MTGIAFLAGFALGAILVTAWWGFKAIASAKRLLREERLRLGLLPIDRSHLSKSERTKQALVRLFFPREFY